MDTSSKIHVTIGDQAKPTLEPKLCRTTGWFKQRNLGATEGMEGTMENNVSSLEKDSISIEREEASEENIDSMSMQSEAPTDDDFPFLEEKNYRSWKDKMEKLLKYKGVWDYVTRAKSEPDQSNEDWKHKKEEIKSIFIKKCGARTLPYIEGLENISLIWSQIVTMYEFTYPTPNTEIMRSKNNTWCLPLYKTIVDDDNWKNVSELVSKNEGVLTTRLTSKGELPLDVAVKHEKVEIAKEVIKKMSTKDLSRQGKEERTALHIAAYIGNKEIVKAIVEKDEKLVMTKSNFYQGRIPFIVAATYSNKDVVNYLYPFTMRQVSNNHKDDDNPREREKVRATILTNLIFGGFYGQALDLLQKYQFLVLTKDDLNLTAMGALSINRTAFRSSLPTTSVGTLGYYFIYSFGSVLDVHIDAKNACCLRRGDEESSLDANGNAIQGNMMMCGLCTSSTNCITLQFCKDLWLCFSGLLLQNALIKLVPGWKNIYEEKLKHYGASELLKEMWRLVSQLDNLDEPRNDVLAKAMFRATEPGIIEFIQECFNNCPQLLFELRYPYKFKREQFEGQTVFHHAISNRQEKVFGFIHHVGPSMKKDLTRLTDAAGNYMSHLAAIKAPIERLNQVPGAALQMQRELLWYKEVESIMPCDNDVYINRKKERPRKLFMEEHKELVKEGAIWMKDTSTQCMVVATLITTIMFAAVFTVPGYSGGEGGEPKINYIQGKFPTIFILSNILALCSSVASMLMFLAIITSRYAEEDFFSTLPRMLMLGLLFLFISIVGMMVAFVAAILFMLQHDVRVWASFPIVFLASIPVTLYALVELLLFIQLMVTTSSSAVFGKKN